jgi:hypothetical protein
MNTTDGDFPPVEPRTLEAELGIPLSPEAMVKSENRLARNRRVAQFTSFLKAYAEHGTVYKACQAANVRRKDVLKWKADDARLQQRFEDAEKQFTEKLENIAHERAAEKSDLLLMFTLKKRDPSYRENFKMEHSGDVSVKVIRYDTPEYANLAMDAPKAYIEGEVIK